MKKTYFLTVCLNPSLQKTIVLPDFIEDGINRSSEYYLDISGKGINVSRVLVQLGEYAIHLTQAGGINKRLFLSKAKDDKIKTETVDSFSEIRFCHTIINIRKKTSTEIIEESEPVSIGTEDGIKRKFLRLLHSCHTLIISGTKAAGFSENIFPWMVKEAKEAGKKVILDYRGEDLINSLAYRPDMIKPNYDEFCSTFFSGSGSAKIGGSDFDDDVSRVKDKMTGLYNEFGITTVLTHGKSDILYIENGLFRSMPVRNIVPLNTIGCGDAFTAGFAAAFHSGGRIRECLEEGMKCASLNALLIKPGVIK